MRSLLKEPKPKLVGKDSNRLFDILPAILIKQRAQLSCNLLRRMPLNLVPVDHLDKLAVLHQRKGW